MFTVSYFHALELDPKEIRLVDDKLLSVASWSVPTMRLELLPSLPPSSMMELMV